jgi:hypothetical protein
VLSDTDTPLDLDPTAGPQPPQTYEQCVNGTAASSVDQNNPNAPTDPLQSGQVANQLAQCQQQFNEQKDIRQTGVSDLSATQGCYADAMKSTNYVQKLQQCIQNLAY